MINAQPQQPTAGAPVGFANVFRHNLSWILAPAFALIVASVTTAFLWADVFQSTATVRYQSKADETDFEKNLNDRMQDVLSRTALKSTIERFALYPNDVKRLPLEDVIENLKRNVHFGRIVRRDESPSRVAVFPISFDYPDRVKAQKVVGELTAQMVVSNLRAASVSWKSGESTELQDAAQQVLEGARKDLDESEALLSEFKEKHGDQLPEQGKANQEMLSTLRAGLTKIQAQIAQATREQAALQTSLSVELEKRRNLKPLAEPAAPEKVDNPKLAAYDSQIQALEDQIKALKVQYTENFPDVKLARAKLDKIRGDRDALLKETAAAKPRPDSDATRGTTAAIDADIKRIQSQMEARSAEAERLAKEGTEMDKTVQALQTKLESGSDLEKQYAELLKDRDLNKTRVDDEEIRYKAALASASPAVAATLGTPILEVVEPATLPSAPIEPNRGFIIGAGSIAGLLLGLVIAAIRGLRPAKPRSEGAASTWLAWAAALVIGVGTMAISIVHYYATRG